jgi:hypothetical protein
MNRQENEDFGSFDKESFVTEFEMAIPQMVAEISDLFEVRPPRISRKARRELAKEMGDGVEFSIPHLKAIEGAKGNIARIDEGYHAMEGLLREGLRHAGVKPRPREDAFDCWLRSMWAILRPHYRIKRLRQYRITRGGVEGLVAAILNRPGGEEAARQLIEEFNHGHSREYMRDLKTLEASADECDKVNIGRMTPRNVRRLTETYRDAAAAFEKRLRLLVGLNYIVCGEVKTYGELRNRGYNQLFQAVDSADNPLLHFLRNVVNRNVRNAMAHASVSTSFSRGKVIFIDYSPGRRQETRVEWTLGELFKHTRNLVLCYSAVAQLELLFDYACMYRKVAGMRYLIANSQSVSLSNSATASASGNPTSVTTYK